MAHNVSSPEVVGRTEDLAQAGEVLQRAAAGEAGFLLIGGEAGIGKTRLLAEILEQARAGGFTVLSGACVDMGEGAPPFAPIADAVRRLRRAVGDERVAAALGPDSAELVALLPGAHVGLDWNAQPGPGRAFEAVRELLEGLAEEAPVLLTVEDAHWADESTRHLLAFLSRTLTDARVALISTFRTDELHRRHPLPALLAELERQAGAVRIDLQPLQRGEVERQLAAILGAPPAQAVVDSIWDRSEGNPFHAEELLLADPDCERLPASVRESMLVRLNRLPESHQAVLRVAAAAGREVSDVLLLELTELPGDEFDRILRDLVDTSMLVLNGDGYRFRHALLQEVVYEELLPGERVRLHVRVAEHLVSHHHGTDDAGLAAELAHHWSRANRNPEALVASVTAGIAAEAVGAPGEALNHYERALELWDTVPDAATRSELPQLDLLERAATATGSVGRFDLGIRLLGDALGLAEAAGDVHRAATLHQVLSRLLFVSDRGGAIEELERAVDLVPAEPLTPERASVLAGYAQLLMLTGRHREARELSQAALDAAVAVGDRQVEGHARNTLGTVLGNIGDERAWPELEQALAIAHELHHVDDIGRAYVNLTSTLAQRGRWVDLERVGAEALAVTRRLGIDRTHGVYAETNVVEGLIATGRWDDAVAAQRSLSARLPSGHWNYFAIDALRADQGAFDELRAVIERAGPLPQHDTAVLQHLTKVYETKIALATWERRPEDAQAVLEEMLGRLPATFLAWNAAPVLWRGTWAEADRAERHRARGDGDLVEEARQAADRWLGVLDDLGRRTPDQGLLPAVGLEAYAALAAAERRRLDADDQADDWLRPATRFDELEIVFPAAYARFRAAEALLRAGDRPAATAYAVEARRVARALGARPLLELVDQLISRGRLAPATETDAEAADDGLGLSPREREVLTLVAAGRTNREIGGLLFISPKTASVHVSNILAKLGVAGRGEAAALAHRLGLV